MCILVHLLSYSMSVNQCSDDILRGENKKTKMPILQFDLR